MTQVTLKDIKRLFSDYEAHEQIDSKQMFICTGFKYTNDAPTRDKILLSYKTRVGYYDYNARQWVLTREKYSPTTSKQMNQFARSHNVRYVESL